MFHHVGLSSEKASELLKKYGENVIEERNKVTWRTILFRQFKSNKIVYFLFAACLLSLAVGKATTAATIFLVIDLVVVVGFIQEYKAEESVKALRSMVKSMTNVYRDGRLTRVESRLLVPGDAILLKGGDTVPADGCIIEGDNVVVNEAILTGESHDVVKNASKNIDERQPEESLLSMGTNVLQGKALVRVTHTGMSTKLGRIADMITKSDKEITLTRHVDQIVNYMIVISLIVATATSVIFLLQSGVVTRSVLVEVVLLLVAVSVSAFPEGLPVVLIATLSSGTKHMAAKNAIVNRMGIVQTLGEVSTICCDKTGTLTMGQMMVKEVVTGRDVYTVTGSGFGVDGTFLYRGKPHVVKDDPLLELTLKAAVICNDAHIEKIVDDTAVINGTATEGALLVMARKAGMTRDDLNYRIIDEKPFDSGRKLMSCIANEHNTLTMYAKGAPEIILALCTYIHNHQGIVPLSTHLQKNLETINEVYAKDGFRTIAIAYKPLHYHTPLKGTYQEKSLVFLGLCVLEDPPRPEVAQAVATCHTAGISVKMITGDQPATAETIGKQIGLEGQVLTGTQIENMTDEELHTAVPETTIFARVKPEHKFRIVRALKNRGEIVAMTGDGVNDAPALKEAHVGIAMGRNGTDVSRSAADITLADDNFATIVTAIHEGRRIFRNIRKFVSYQLSCNLAALSVNFGGVAVGGLLGWNVPLLTALQILFMNLVTDNMPAISLGFTRADRYIMHEKPQKSARPHILNKTSIALIVGLGISMAILTLAVQYAGVTAFGLDSKTAQTSTLVAIILLQIVNSFHFRSFRHGVLSESPFRNPHLIVASGLSIVCTLLIIYTPLRDLFEVKPLGWTSWYLILVAAGFYMIYVDIIKLVYNGITRKSFLVRV
jgi:Ca2+-transporting ATPase